jgi:hypothetical protein
MCYERRRAEASVDESAHHALVNAGETRSIFLGCCFRVPIRSLFAMNPRYAALPALLALLEAMNAGCLIVIWRRGERQVCSRCAVSALLTVTSPVVRARAYRPWHVVRRLRSRFCHFGSLASSTAFCCQSCRYVLVSMRCGQRHAADAATICVRLQ